MQESTHKVPKSASQAVLSRMQLTLVRLPDTSRRFALGASNACLVSGTRRAPSRHYTDARVYGLKPTAMNDMGIHPSAQSPPSSRARPAPPANFEASPAPSPGLAPQSHSPSAVGRRKGGLL